MKTNSDKIFISQQSPEQQQGCTSSSGPAHSAPPCCAEGSLHTLDLTFVPLKQDTLQELNSLQSDHPPSIPVQHALKAVVLKYKFHILHNILMTYKKHCNFVLTFLASWILKLLVTVHCCCHFFNLCLFQPNAVDWTWCCLLLHTIHYNKMFLF